MKIRSAAAPARSPSSELLIGLAFEGATPKPSPELAAAVRAAKKTGDLRDEFRATSVFHQAGADGPSRLAFVGGGDRKALTTERLRRMAAVAQQLAEARRVKAFHLVVEGSDHRGIDAFTAGTVVAEGLALGAYRFAAPSKDKPKARSGQQATVLYRGREERAFLRGVKHGTVTATGTVFARDLGNMAPNRATPTYLASAAKKFANARVKVRVLEEAEMRRLGMGSLLGVSQGSTQPAKLIVMEYAPRGADQTVCVVGKGLTFDSGGISIKPSAKMDEMRYDMCGGGAVLGFFRAIADGALDGVGVRVIGVVAAVENMPDGNAQRPGDVVTAMNGTTIEVLNTDAEGRLVLADALAYAIDRYAPDAIVDLATLTGAVIVALGHEAAGVMGNDDAVIEGLVAAGDATDEPVWELPLWDVHKEQIKSKFADVANLNSPAHGNGSTAGGAFLWHFVGDTPWAHLDIAGTAWGGRAKDYYRNGASGTAVRMLVSWVRGMAR